jgi:hypothetical protein
MSIPSGTRREHPGTYFVQDRSNEEELTSRSTEELLDGAESSGSQKAISLRVTARL